MPPGPQMYDVDVEDPHEHDDEPSAIKEVVITILAALLLAYLVQGFLVKPFRIPSGSMENTLKCGDRVLVNRVSTRFWHPHRGDIVVFHPPAGVDDQGRADPDTVAGEDGTPVRKANGDRTVHKANLNYIKRVIGLPGDRVEVRQHHAVVNGKPLKEPYLHPLPKGLGITSEGETEPFTVPKGTYFMMGDHRDNSADGRVFGPVPRGFIVGKAFMVYWPPARFGGLPDKDPGGPAAARPDQNCIETIPQGASGG